MVPDILIADTGQQAALCAVGVKLCDESDIRLNRRPEVESLLLISFELWDGVALPSFPPPRLTAIS